MLPIRTRLTLVYCAMFCLSTVVLEVGAYVAVSSGINLILDRELAARLGGISDFLNEHVGRRTLPKLQSELSSHAALQPQFLRIQDSAGTEIFRGNAMRAQSFYPLRITTARWKHAGMDYQLFLGTDLTLANELLMRFRSLLLVSSPLFLAAAAAAGYFISKRALGPVSQMTLAARSINAANLGQRLAVPQSADELQDLAETLNGMLGRIEDAFRHVSQFTANASHELRTPVALIRTTSEVALLKTNGTAETYRDALHRILRESEKSTFLLDDMLRLARADSTTRVVALCPVDLNQHLATACDRVLPLAEEKGIALRYLPSRHSIAVSANQDHLKRLWLILLDNAIKYTPTGGSVHVSIRQQTPDQAICEFRDTGIGIAEADKQRIFERFYRADRARTREEGGAGLGLSIARWIAEIHNARIDVESAPGQGSAFRVTLPALPQSEPSAPAVETQLWEPVLR